MNKLTIGMAVLFTNILFSQLSFANEFNKFTVSIPCYNGGLTFGLAGLYLRPSVPDLDFALATPQTVDQFGLASYKSGSPDYDWGFRINLGYIFPGTGNDICLTYTRFDKETSDHFLRRENESVIDVQTGNAASIGSTSLNNNNKFNYQTVDLDFGQHIVKGCSLSMRMFGGVRYLNLDQDFKTDFVETIEELANLIDQSHTKQNSRYSGVGPRLGAQGNYHIWCGVGVVGQVATTLLVGEIDSKYQENNDFALANELILDQPDKVSYDDLVRVVPNVDARIGLDYHYQFCNASRTRFIVEAGYQVYYYFNTVDRIATTQIVTPALRGRHTLDTSFDGAYLGIQVEV